MSLKINFFNVCDFGKAVNESGRFSVERVVVGLEVNRSLLAKSDEIEENKNGC